VATISRLLKTIGLFCKRDYILQKRPIILRSLQVVATPYAHVRVKRSCSQKQLSEGVLDEPDLLASKLEFKFDITEVLRHVVASAHRRM